MKSWQYWLWFRRFLPILTIVVVWFGITTWNKWQQEREEKGEHRLALTMAQVWLASATYRYDPEQFIAYRDSLLKAEGIEKKRYLSILHEYRDMPEATLPFVELVRRLTDSLVAREDSLWQLREHSDDDSTKQSLTPDNKVFPTDSSHSAGKASG